jgi:hypothetical protein
VGGRPSSRRLLKAPNSLGLLSAAGAVKWPPPPAVAAQEHKANGDANDLVPADVAMPGSSLGVGMCTAGRYAAGQHGA